MNITGRVAWITGGTKGMGFATARLLIEKGAKVLITARDEKTGEEAQAELGENCLFVKADVTDTDSMQAAVSEAMKKWGRLDVLVSNAGGGTHSWCLPMRPSDEAMKNQRYDKWIYDETADGAGILESFRHNIDVNLIGSFDACRLAAWEIRKNTPDENGERGTIILISSSGAFLRHSPGLNCGYAAAKAGLIGLRKEMAVNLGQAGIRVNAVIPGFFDTDIVQSIGFLKKIWEDCQIFPKKAGDPANVAHLVLELIENTFINNASIEITGGGQGTVSFDAD